MKRRRRIDDSVVASVLELHALHTPHREIARQLDLARSTVDAIVGGWRPARREPVAYVSRSRVASRCPGCGGMVFMPCEACKVNRMREAARLKRKQLREAAEAFREILA